MHKRYFLLPLFFILFWPLPKYLHAQKATEQNSKLRMSCPEIWWGIGHPFIAIKAYRISKETLSISKDVAHDKLLQNDWNGGQMDAFKHAYWMASLTKQFGQKPSMKLGDAHERGNYRLFKRRIRRNKPSSHDRAAQEMDLANNQSGALIAEQYPEINKDQMKEIIIDHIQAGRLKIIKKNNKGEFLDTKDVVIPDDQMQNIWDNGKILVGSDYIFR